MPLSVPAKLYLTWQLFDAVNREPTRTGDLPEEIPGLLAWPDFRQDVMNDPRFLVSEDLLDVATAGIPANSPLEQIIIATLDRARMPMRDRDLERVVFRLRPTLPASTEIIGQALRSADLFRPRTGHLARRRWLAGARPLELPPDLPDDPFEAAEAYLERVGTRVSAVSLAAALAERFGLSIAEAYGMAVDPTFLPLPDGTVCLYLPVEDEITAAVEALETGEPAPQGAEEQTAGVALTDLEEGVPLPSDLAAAVARFTRERGQPVTTAAVLESVVRVAETDDRYLVTYWAVNRVLGLAPELMAVGDHLWIDTASVPGEVFRRLPRRPAVQESAVPALRPESPAPSTTGKKPVSEGSRTVSILLSDPEIRTGCIADPRLASHLPDHPLIQALRWNGQPAWYNADTFTLAGLGPWFRATGAAPGDAVQIRVNGADVEAVFRPSVDRLSEPPAQVVRTEAGPRGRNLYAAVVDLLTRAGGVLDRDELVELLRESDPREWRDLEWNDLEALFRRYPSLKLAGDLCVLITLSGRQNGSAAHAEILVLLDGLSPRNGHHRENPAVLDLVKQAAAAARVSASRQTVLAAHARLWLEGAGTAEDLEALEELTAAFRRMVVRQLLGRADLEELLPWLDDLFQEGCYGLLQGFERYDPDKGNLSGALGWSVRGAISRAKAEIIHPIRLPAHMHERVERAAQAWWIGAETDDLHAAELRARVFLPWEECAWEYEDGSLALTPLTLASPGPEPGDLLEETERREILQEVLETLSPKEQEVIRQRWGLDGREPRTLEQVGRHFGITRERIRQIEEKAFIRLRHPVRIRRLREVF